MDITNMKELYAELIKAAGRGFRNRSITNPAVVFTQKAKAGVYDSMTDEEYYEELDKVEELNRVWQHKTSKTVGELLLTALENLNIRDEDVEDISATLMCAYSKTDQESIPCDSDASGRVSDIIFGDHHDRRTGGEAEEIEENILYEDEIPSEASGQVSHILSSPARIYEYLDSKVYGQKDAKRAVEPCEWQETECPLCRSDRLW